jgi:hypothetical protein
MNKQLFHLYQNEKRKNKFLLEENEKKKRETENAILEFEKRTKELLLQEQQKQELEEQEIEIFTFDYEYEYDNSFDERIENKKLFPYHDEIEIKMEWNHYLLYVKINNYVNQEKTIYTNKLLKSCFYDYTKEMEKLMKMKYEKEMRKLEIKHQKQLEMEKNKIKKEVIYQSYPRENNYLLMNKLYK